MGRRGSPHAGAGAGRWLSRLLSDDNALEYPFGMRPGGGLVRVLCLLALFMGCVALGAQQGAPVTVVDGLGRATAALDGPWRFHTGDDPAWASAGFDDSAWETTDISRPWGDQGHWAYAGRAWYRRQIEFKGDVTDLALYVPETTCAYEVYWNGRLIGSTDRMPEPTMLNDSVPQVFRLGDARRGVLAFRASTTPLDSTTAGNGFGLMAVPRVGSMEAIHSLAVKEHVRAIKRDLLTAVQIVIYGQLFLVGFVVWMRSRKQKLLFWMSAFLLSAAAWLCLDPTFFPLLLNTPVACAFYGPTFHSLEDIALWYLLLYLLDLDRYPKLVRWTRVLAWATFACAVTDDLIFLMPARDTHPLNFEVLDAIVTVGFSLPEIFPLVLIALAFRKQMNPARRVVAIAAFLSDMYFVVAHTAEQGERFTRWTLYRRMTQPLFTIDGVSVSMPAILSLLLACAIVYAVFRYTVDEGQRQRALEQEYRNARAVQQVLIPEAIPQLPGFAIDSYFQPAGEVGGDFFQILPAKGGGVLAVIGDVSGKGMPAAMTVSLLVGTVRTLAHYVDSPGEMLAAMNERMLGRSQGGFTTCLVVRIDARGTVTMANAGHIAPYSGGKEVSLQNGLPLGLAAKATYPEVVVSLAPGEQLTLLTDGVVEARDPSGELFGFERTAAISTLPAKKVALAAQEFGQDDDITVVSLTWKGVGEATSAAFADPALSPA